MSPTPEADHFVLGRNTMLENYRLAKKHSSSQPVQVDHGIVGEEFFRKWLINFLPIKYGVTSGYIFSQDLRNHFQKQTLEHFDVIVYDKVSSPVLWVEENPGSSDQGLKRAIPAEHVLSVVEVKASFTRQNLENAMSKLCKLEPLYVHLNQPGDPYPKYLNNNYFSYIFFFELLKQNTSSLSALSSFIQSKYHRGTPSEAFILSYESDTQSNSGILTIATIEGDTNWTSSKGLFPAGFSDLVKLEGNLLTAYLSWFDINFSRFAFDFLARLDGTFNPRRISSFHGLPKL